MRAQDVFLYRAQSGGQNDMLKCDGVASVRMKKHRKVISDFIGIDHWYLFLRTIIVPGIAQPCPTMSTCVQAEMES